MKICSITNNNITFSAVFIWNILNHYNAFGDLHKSKNKTKKKNNNNKAVKKAKQSILKKNEARQILKHLIT